MGKHHFRALFPEIKDMGRDFDLDERAIFLVVLPDTGFIGLSVFNLRDVFQQARHVALGTYVRNCHREKFVAAVTVVFHRGIIHHEKAQSGEVVHPHRMWIGFEQLPIAEFALT